MEICPACKADLRDYGGYKDKMNPLGVNLTDVWMDMAPVRHYKYKKRKGSNELPVKLMDRIIQMASEEDNSSPEPCSVVRGPHMWCLKSSGVGGLE